MTERWQLQVTRGRDDDCLVMITLYLTLKNNIPQMVELSLEGVQGWTQYMACQDHQVTRGWPRGTTRQRTGYHLEHQTNDGQAKQAQTFHMQIKTWVTAQITIVRYWSRKGQVRGHLDRERYPSQNESESHWGSNGNKRGRSCVISVTLQLVI
jgi:hypothetical protein